MFLDRFFTFFYRFANVFLQIFYCFFGSSGLREASGTHVAPISVSSVRANSLYEVLQTMRRLADRFFTVFAFFERLFIVFLTFPDRIFTVSRHRFLAFFLRRTSKKKH